MIADIDHFAHRLATFGYYTRDGVWHGVTMMDTAWRAKQTADLLNSHFGADEPAIVRKRHDEIFDFASDLARARAGVVEHPDAEGA